MPEERISKQMLSWLASEKSKRGSPKISWTQGVEMTNHIGTERTTKRLAGGRRHWQLETGRCKML